MKPDEIDTLIENRAKELASQVLKGNKTNKKYIYKKIAVRMIKRGSYSFFKYGWYKYTDGWGKKWWISFDN